AATSPLVSPVHALSLPQSAKLSPPVQIQPPMAHGECLDERATGLALLLSLAPSVCHSGKPVATACRRGPAPPAAGS
ncbi:unnamed protein product, partial [Urochloa humidicola]